MHSRRLAPALLLLLLAPVRPAECQQQPASTFFVNDDDQVDGCKQLKRLLAAEKRGGVPNLAEAYQKILETASPAGVVAERDPVDGEPYQLQVGVRQACRDRLARLSPDRLAEYRAAYDGVAAEQFRAALERRNLDALRDVSEKYGATSIGGEVLLAIAGLSLEEGDLEGAYVALDPLVQNPKQFSLSPARSRLAVFLLAQCARGLGRWERLSLLDRGATQGDPAVYDAPIQLGAKSVALRDALHQLAAGAPAPTGKLIDIANVKPWVFRIPPPPPPEPVASQRQAMVFLGGPGTTVHQELDLWDPSIEAGVSPSCAAASGSPWVFLHTGQEGVVLDARTGASPGWQWSISSLQTAADATDNASDKARLTRRACLCGRRLYAVLESGWAELKAKDAARDAGSKMLRCSLYAFDLDREGYRLWDTERLRLEDPPSPTGPDTDSPRTASFVSPPVVSGGKVYAAAATLRNDGVQLFLCAFDAETGEPRWSAYLGAKETGTNAFQQMEVAQHLFPGLAPVVVDGKVVYCSNWGVVAALDAGNGEVQWVVKYGRKKDLTLRGGTGIDWAENPVQVQDGVVVVAPQDSDYLFTVELATGKRLCQKPFERATRGEQFRYLLALSHGRVALVSDKSVWVGHADEPIHQAIRPVLLMEPALGRPLVDGEDVYIPGAKALYRVRLDGSQKTEEVLRWPDKAAGGIDLVRTDGGLVALTRDRVYGYAR